MVTVTSSDPPFISSQVKALLREKNKLMRSGHLKQANSLADRVVSLNVQYHAGRLRNANFGVDVTDVWEMIRDITGKKKLEIPHLGVDSASLNAHYATISSEPSYISLLLKSTCSPPPQWPSEEAVFHYLLTAFMLLLPILTTFLSISSS